MDRNVAWFEFPHKAPAIGTAARSAAVVGAIAGSIIACGEVLGGHLGILLGLGVGVVAVVGMWWFSDRIVIRSAGAQSMDGHAASDLNRMLRELAQRATIPVPRLYVAPNSQPNAFAIGRTQRHAAIVVTEGLLSLLEPTEIRAVLAHELIHISRRDTVVTSMAGATARGIFLVTELPKHYQRRRGSACQEDPGIVVASLTSVAAGLLRFALSGSRESAADRGASDLTGDPEALARALTRIHGYVQVVPMEMTLAYASPWVVNPLRNGVEASWLFSTHPTVADRIGRLRSRPSQRAAI